MEALSANQMAEADRATSLALAARHGITSRT